MEIFCKKKRKVVDFHNNNFYKNNHGHSYYIDITKDIPKNCNIDIEIKEKIINVYDYKNMNDFNYDINRILQDIHKKDFKVGEYEFKNAQGTVYMFFASIDKRNINNILVEHFTDSLVMIIKDGQNSQKSIFLFDDERLKNINNLEKIKYFFVKFPKSNIWCCEK